MSLNRNDYAPGSVGAIRRVAATIDRLGTDFGDAKRELLSVNASKDASGWFGASATQFQLTLEELPSDLGQMEVAHHEVADALSDYAQKLERLQEQVDQAIEKLRIKQQERATAGEKAGLARNRIRSLTAQLVGAKATEGAAWANYQRTRFDPIPGGEAEAYRYYQQAQQRTQGIESEKADAEGVKYHWEQREEQAKSDCHNLEKKLKDYRGARKAAEEHCAGSIEEALPKGLKNPKMWQKAGGWLKEQGEKFLKASEALAELVDSVLTGNWADIVNSARKFAQAFAACLDVVALALVVAAAVVTVATAGAGLPVAVAMLQIAAGLANVSKWTKGVSAAVGVGLAATGAKGADGRPVETWSEAIDDGVEFGVSWGLGKGMDKVVPGIKGKNIISGTKDSLGVANQWSPVYPNLVKRELDYFARRQFVPRVVGNTAWAIGKPIVKNTVMDGVDPLIPDEHPWDDAYRYTRVDETVDEALEGRR